MASDSPNAPWADRDHPKENWQIPYQKNLRKGRGMQRGAAGAERDLGRRLREARQQVKGREVESRGSGGLCDQAIQDLNIRGGIGSKKIGVA